MFQEAPVLLPWLAPRERGFTRSAGCRAGEEGRSSQPSHWTQWRAAAARALALAAQEQAGRAAQVFPRAPHAAARLEARAEAEEATLRAQVGREGVPLVPAPRKGESAGASEQLRRRTVRGRLGERSGRSSSGGGRTEGNPVGGMYALQARAVIVLRIVTQPHRYV